MTHGTIGCLLSSKDFVGTTGYAPAVFVGDDWLGEFRQIYPLLDNQAAFLHPLNETIQATRLASDGTSHALPILQLDVLLHPFLDGGSHGSKQRYGTVVLDQYVGGHVRFSLFGFGR
jgi:hypothetical protein